MKIFSVTHAVFLWACLIGGGIGWAGQAAALELGMTPSHVVGLWRDINRVFIEYQRDTGLDPKLLAEIEAMKPAVFHGKRPKDVFARATAVYKTLQDECGLSELPPLPDWVEEFQNREKVTDHTETTPSEVYLLSARILNRLVEKYEKDAHGDYPVSGFYKDHGLKDNIPSNAFAMVDLMSRRLNAVLAAAKSQPPPAGEGR